MHLLLQDFPTISSLVEFCAQNCLQRFQDIFGNCPSYLDADIEYDLAAGSTYVYNVYGTTSLA